MANKKQFAVIGLGRFGESVAITLTNMGHEVMAVDVSEEKIEEISKKVTFAVQADATDEKALKQLGLRNFDVAIIAIGDIDIKASILATMLAKEYGVEHVVAKAQSELHGKVLSKTGADRIVFPERDMGVRVAHNLASTNILDHIEVSPDYRIAEISTSEKMVGKTLKELDLRAKYGLNVLAVKRNKDRNKDIDIAPNANKPFEEGDIMIIIGREGDLSKIENLC